MTKRKVRCRNGTDFYLPRPTEARSQLSRYTKTRKMAATKCMMGSYGWLYMTPSGASENLGFMLHQAYRCERRRYSIFISIVDFESPMECATERTHRLINQKQKTFLIQLNKCPSWQMYWYILISKKSFSCSLIESTLISSEQISVKSIHIVVDKCSHHNNNTNNIIL